MDSTSLPALLGGRYRPIRLIGRGAMGRVYEVEHVHTGDRLALKVLSDKAMEGDGLARFKREARAAARIKSDHVVRVTDADTAPELGGAPYLVMELLEGTDLERAIGDQPRAPTEVVAWLRQVAHALDKAHALGIIHRDLKPENLFLCTADGGVPRVKVLDFGVAKMSAERDATSSGQIIGTPTYMSPEQAKGGGAVTPACDRFALGLIAFRLLVGQSFWRGEGVIAIVNELLYEKMPRASERGSTLGEAFDEWFARACARDPERRFASAAAQVEALAKALGVATVSIPSFHTSWPSMPDASGASLETAATLAASASVVTGRSGSTWRRSRTRRTIAIATAAVVVAGGAAFVLLRAGAPPASRATEAKVEPRAEAKPATSAPSEPAPLAAPVATSAPRPSLAAPSAPDAAAPRPSSTPRAPSAKPSRPAAPRVDPLADQK